MKLQLFILGVFLSACSSPSSPSDTPAARNEAREAELRREATQAIREERFREARELLDELYRQNPRAAETPEALLERAMCYPEGTVDRAERMKRVVDRFPGSETAKKIIGNPSDYLGWNFSELKLGIGVSGEREIEAQREAGPPSTFTVYRVPLEAHLKSIEDLPGSGARDEWILVGREIHRFRARNDSGTLHLRLKEPGDYVVEESIEGFKKLHELQLGTFGVIVKAVVQKVMVYAVDLQTGAPVGGVELRLRMKTRTLSGRTGQDGLAFFDGPSDMTVLAWRGDEVHACKLECDGSWTEPLVYITTDRPVYRPGQAVQYKAVWRDRRDERLSFVAGEKVSVEIRDPQGRILQRSEQAWNDAGSLSGSFRLGEEPDLGRYYVVVMKKFVEAPRNARRGGVTFSLDGDDDPEPWIRGSFEVAAYRKPEIGISIGFGSAAPVAGEKVKARIRAEYYFGGPVADAEVEWTVTKAAFERSLGRASLDDPRAWFYRGREWSWDDLWSEDDHLAQGTGRTGADGVLEVEFTPNGESRHYQVHAVVRDLSRLTVEAAESLEVQASSLTVDIRSPRQFFKPGEKVEPRVTVTTPDGKPAANCAVEVVVLLGQDVGGEREYESFFSTTVRTDVHGKATAEFPVTRGGKLRLRAQVKDSAGRIAQDREDVWVAGDEAVGKDTGLLDLRVVPDRILYEEGETIRLMILTSFRPLTALLTVEGGTIQEARVVRLEHACEILEIPARASFVPNVFIKLMAWKEGRAIGGGYNVCVYPRRHLLDVEISTPRATYAPREKARISLVTRAAGGPVAADVELSIVDESIFAIKKEKTGDIRSRFLDVRREESQTQGTCPMVDTYEEYSFDRIPMLATTLSAGEPEEGQGRSVRQWFPDTLYYAGHVRTGPDGKAELEIEMPDTLTAWRITARAVSGPDRFGQATSTLLTRKGVSIRLEAPRFYTERDEGIVSTIVQNNLGLEAEFNVTLNVGTGGRKLKVPAHGMGRLDWAVRAASAGTMTLRAEASAELGSDAVEISVPVRAHGTPYRSVFSASVADAWHQEIVVGPGDAKDSASLDITVTSTGISAVLESLPFLAGYPYGCVEQTMSRFLPSVVASEALRRSGARNEALDRELPDMVTKGLHRLYGFQHEDGGWGWWKHDATRPFMTAYAMYGLLVARRSGFVVDERTVRKGLEKLRDMEATPLGLYVRGLGGDTVTEALAALVEKKIRTVEENAYLILAGRKDLVGQLRFLPPEHADAQGFREAALVLRALHSVDPRDSRLGPLVDWLLKNRRGDVWVSTLDTAYVVYALCETTAAIQEPDVRIRLDGQEIAGKSGSVRIPGSRLNAGAHRIDVERRGGGPAFASAVLRGVKSEEGIAGGGAALEVTRSLERARVVDGEKRWEPIASGSQVKVGDELRIQVKVTAPRTMEYVMVETPIPAGTEPREEEPSWFDWDSLWYGRREMRDDRVSVAATHVYQENEFSFRLRASFPGTYHVMPAAAFPMYDPDTRGTSDEFILKIVDR
jgi:uncharacterized protein YfaS (alpha-2-macroglobulin family)